MIKKINHEALFGITMGVLEDLDLVNERYKDLVITKNVRKFTTAFKGEYSIYNLNNPNNIYNPHRNEQIYIPNQKYKESTISSKEEESYEEEEDEEDPKK